MGDNFLDRELEFPFVDKKTGEKVKIKARDVELAVLRAWAKNQNLTFDVSAVTRCINGMVG